MKYLPSVSSVPDAFPDGWDTSVTRIKILAHKERTFYRGFVCLEGTDGFVCV